MCGSSSLVYTNTYALVDCKRNIEHHDRIKHVWLGYKYPISASDKYLSGTRNVRVNLSDIYLLFLVALVCLLFVSMSVSNNISENGWVAKFYDGVVHSTIRDTLARNVLQHWVQGGKRSK